MITRAAANSAFVGTTVLVVNILIVGACAARGPKQMRPEDYWSDSNVLALATAIDLEDLEKIDVLVRRGVDVNAPHLSKSGQVDMRPLCWAMYRKKKAAYKRLLDCGADPSLRFVNYPSFLHFAALSLGDDSDWLSMALEHGDPNVGRPDFGTPIFKAIFNAPIESIDLLIAAGADLNCREPPLDLGLGDAPGLGDTPLLYAGYIFNFQAVHRLLEAGADYRLRGEGFDGDLAYLVVRSSAVDPQSESGRWREKVADWLVSAGVDLRDARRRMARTFESNRSNPAFSKHEETMWLELQKQRADRWLAIEPHDARDRRLRGTGRLDTGRLDEAIADFTRAVEMEPRNAVNYVLRARAWRTKALWNVGDPAEERERAVADNTAAIEIDRAYAEAYAERAAVRGAQEKYPEAVADYTTAIEFYPNEPNAAPWLWWRGDARRQIFSAAGDRDELDRALADCDRSIALVKDDPQAHRARGDVLAAQGEYGEAIAEYSEAIKLHRHCALAYEGRARCWAAQGDQARADANRKEVGAFKTRYADLLDVWEFQPVIDDLTGTLNDNPRNAQALAEMAQLLAACPDRQFRDGPKSLEYAIKACELTAFKEAQPLAALAAAHAQLGNLDEAVQWQQRAIDAQPDEPPGRELLDLPVRKNTLSALWGPPRSDNPKDEMRERLVELKFEKALAGPNEAVRACPGDPAGYVERAAARWRFARESGRRDEYALAIDDCNRAVELDDNYALAYFWRGRCRQGDYDKAIDDYSEAIRLDPNDAEAYCARGAAFIESAQVMGVFTPMGATRGKYDLAIDDLTAAVRLNADYDFAFYLRGTAWAAKKEHSKAVQDYTRALEIDAETYMYYSDRARSWLALGESDKAVADCDSALALKPADADALEVHGDAWFAKKEYDRALADYEAAGKQDKRRDVLKAAGRFQPLLDELKADVREHPQGFVAYEELALLLASCPDPSCRDGKKAVEHAKKACELTQWKRPRSLAVLAAAFAETGDYAEAANWQTKALEAASKDAVKAEYRRRLALYEQGKPYREGDQTTDKSVNGTE